MQIFVFGSNLAGRHGKGAAAFALKHHGAIPGVGTGLQGQSYGIPTKDQHIRRRSLIDIHLSVIEFLVFAGLHPEMEFNVTRIGCGYAGYTDTEIAPMFACASANCKFPREWEGLLGGAHEFHDLKEEM